MDSSYEYPQFLNLEEALPEDHVLDPSMCFAPYATYPPTLDGTSTMFAHDFGQGCDPLFHPNQFLSANNYHQCFQSCSAFQQVHDDHDFTNTLNSYPTYPSIDGLDYTHTSMAPFTPPDARWLYDPTVHTSPSPPTSHMLDHEEPPSEEPAGLVRAYVSLSDVNAFVAKADSAKHSALLQMSLPPSPNDFVLGDKTCLSGVGAPGLDSALTANGPTSVSYPSCLIESTKRSVSLSSLSNGDSDSVDEDSESDFLCTPPMSWSSSPLPRSNTSSSKPTKLVIKIKNPHSNKKSYSLPSLTSRKNSKVSKKEKRKGSTTHRLAGQVRVSDSISSFLARQRLSDDEDEDEGDEEGDDEDDEDAEGLEADEDDDEYQIRHSATGTAQTKKGRNVDKACNHCKRSHLRCDDMRPCRRCIATGKTGCKDVQHKPRGRPKLHKK